MFLALLLSQMAIVLCQSQCTQPSYDYNPYSPTGYSYNYVTYMQPAYDRGSVNTIVYPYPVPVVYESAKEEKSSCCCGRKSSERNQPSSDNYRYEGEREYSSARCTCTSSEYERRYSEHRENKPKCGCRHPDEYSRGPDRYDDGDYESSDCGGGKVKCICTCDETRSENRNREDRRQRHEDRGCRYREAGDCDCRRKNKYDDYWY